MSPNETDRKFVFPGVKKKHPPFKKRQLVEMGDDMEPMEVDPPLEDDLTEVDPPPSEHMGHHTVTVRPTRRDCAPEITSGMPHSVHLCPNGHLDASADPPIREP